jgi:FMN phosphatase YigB (HAD superfamily)
MEMTRFILDLDDTITNTTQDLGMYAAISVDPTRLTFVEGAEEFLERYGHCSILVSSGFRRLQRRKLAHLQLSRYLNDRMHIVPIYRGNHHAYRGKERLIAQLVAEHGDPSDVIVIGDRIDREITIGNRLGSRTVRVRLPQGKYSGMEPRSDNECPHHTVRNFHELMRIIPILVGNPCGSPAE